MIALPLYVIGAILYILAIFPLFIGDYVSGSNSSNELLHL